MTDHVTRPMLSALLDGELSAADAATAKEHLESCAACRAEYETLKATRAAMRQHLKPLQAPELLRARLRAALDAERALPAATQRRTPWLGLIAAGLLIAAVSSVVTRMVIRDAVPASSIAVSDVVASHVRSLMTNHLTDVVSNDEHNVKPWFDGKVPFAPSVPRLDSLGFPLIGGRVDSVGHDVVAALVYGRRKHLINLFTWPRASGVRVGSETRSDTEHGYNVIRWADGDMQFAAASDVAMGDLQEFVAVFRRNESGRGQERREP